MAPAGASTAAAATPRPDAAPDGDRPVQLSLDDKRRLLRLARRSVECAAGVRTTLDTEEVAWSPTLRAALATFVSLHRREDGRLRGCIGWLEPHAALAEAVIDNAASAAMRDPRFPPVEASEIDDLEIEISVLGPMLDVDDVDTIQVGRDGLVIVVDGVRGVLLPQVAVHMGWSRTQFLEAVCRKAGLATDAWRRDAWIRRFEAVVFSETDPGVGAL
jgi:AmmeMemoRadiSam system protein A